MVLISGNPRTVLHLTEADKLPPNSMSRKLEDQFHLSEITFLAAEATLQTARKKASVKKQFLGGEKFSHEDCRDKNEIHPGEQHQHVAWCLAGGGDDQTQGVGIFSLGQTLRGEQVHQDDAVWERDQRRHGVQPGVQGEEQQLVADKKEHKVLRLRGGAPDVGTCCESICPMQSNKLCETCGHHVCFVHSISVDAYIMCGHCDDRESSDSEEMFESIPLEEISEDDDDNEEEMRKCENCKIECKYLIPHLKQKNSAGCRDFYFRKYLKEFSPNVSDNLKTLGRIVNNQRKTEKQRLKRLNKEYRDKIKNDQQEARHRKKIDPNNMIKEYEAKVEGIMSKHCEACKSYVSPKDAGTVRKESCHYSEDAPIFVCKWCVTIEQDLERWMTLGLNDDEQDAEYQIWARENFSLPKKMSSLRKIITSNDHPHNVGVLIFNENLRRYYVAFPVTNADGGETRIEESLDGYENNDPMVLLPETFLEDVVIETVSKEVFELASRCSQIDFVDLMSIFFKDRLKKMNFAKRSRINRNVEYRKGSISENKLSLMDANSMKGALENIRGTTDYLTKHRNETQFKQWQNGTTNIRFSYAVFNGFQSIHTDSIMAKCILQTKGYHFASLQKENEENKPAKEYRLQCCVDCDPFDCDRQDHHPTALEKVQSSPQDVDPLSVSRFLSEKVTAFINKCVEPIATDYDLFLLFDRPTGQDAGVGLPADSGFAPDSGFSLSGHIWIDKLTQCNTSDEKLPTGEDVIPWVLKKENLKQMLGDGFGGAEVIQKFVDWPDQLYSCENESITSITAKRVDSIEAKSLREMSIFEAIFSCGKNLKMFWTSQSVKLIDTTDPRKVCNITSI